MHSRKKWRPAWTDRILWRIQPKRSQDEEESGSTTSSADKKEFSLKVVQHKYTCDASYGVSDHKPVIGTFNLEVSSAFSEL